ncbi:MAG: hypothetical protein JF619_29495 [Massilia sp.]|nr:hypothetical protein [Massilia sp.]
MAIIIKDLPESVELDRQAMLAITGGARFRARPGLVGRSAARSHRLFNYASSLAGKPSPPTSKPANK